MSFVCKRCGKKVPKSEYWDTWSILIGEFCKNCQLERIAEGEDYHEP